MFKAIILGKMIKTPKKITTTTGTEAIFLTVQNMEYWYNKTTNTKQERAVIVSVFVSDPKIIEYAINTFNIGDILWIEATITKFKDNLSLVLRNNAIGGVRLYQKAIIKGDRGEYDNSLDTENPNQENLFSHSNEENNDNSFDEYLPI